MEKREAAQIIFAVMILTVVIGFGFMLSRNITAILLSLLFAFIIIGSNVLAKKLAGSSLDLEALSDIWKSKTSLSRKKIYWGAILPLAISILSVGAAQLTTILSYETTARKNPKKRLGVYSVTEITDWHNSLIGVAGIIATLLVSFISYWIPNAQALFQAAAFYALFNMAPISKLDGNQIFSGSRVVWTVLALITAINFAYAVILA